MRLSIIVVVLILNTVYERAHASEASPGDAGFYHKYLFAAVSIHQKHKRAVNHKNINFHVDELTNIDELTAFANIFDQNRNYLKSYVAPNGEYLDTQSLASAIMEGWYPRIEGQPIVPTQFGRHVLRDIGRRQNLDFYIDLLVKEDLVRAEERRNANSGVPSIPKATSPNEEAVLLAQHTGIELRSRTLDKCSTHLELAVESSLAAPLFYASEGFRSRVLDDEFRNLQRYTCMRRGGERQFEVSVLRHNEELASFILTVQLKDRQFTFTTSNPSKAFVVENPAVRSFFDKALERMAGDEIKQHFPHVTVPPLQMSDIEDNAVGISDAAFLLALSNSGERKERDVFRKMFHLQGPVVKPCDFDGDAMAYASNLGHATASFLSATCLFDSAEKKIAGIRFGAADVDFTRIDEEILLLLFHTAKYMHKNRMLHDGFDLASHIRYYDAKVLLEMSQAFVDSNSPSVDFAEYIEYMQAQ